METGRAANAKRQPFTSLHWRTNRRTRRPTPAEPNDSQSDHFNCFSCLDTFFCFLYHDIGFLFTSRGLLCGSTRALRANLSSRAPRPVPLGRRAQCVPGSESQSSDAHYFPRPLLRWPGAVQDHDSPLGVSSPSSPASSRPPLGVSSPSHAKPECRRQNAATTEKRAPVVVQLETHPVLDLVILQCDVVFTNRIP